MLNGSVKTGQIIYSGQIIRLTTVEVSLGSTQPNQLSMWFVSGISKLNKKKLQHDKKKDPYLCLTLTGLRSVDEESKHGLRLYLF
jgi:hypothetical protein